MRNDKDTQWSQGCSECQHLTGRFHCGACGFDGGQSLARTTTVESEHPGPKLDALKRIQELVTDHEALGRGGSSAERVIEQIARELAPFRGQFTVQEVMASLDRVQRHVVEGDLQRARLVQRQLYERVLAELAERGHELARLALTVKKLVT